VVNLGGISQCSDEQIEALTEDAIRRYIQEVLGGLEQQTPRFRYLFLRLQRTMKLVIQNVVEELRSSQFQPMFFELGFGWGKALPPVEVTQEDITLSVSGFVDRVDGWLKDGRLYLKVVDYKTGRKSFDFTDIWNGLGLQMLLYLFALEDHGKLLGQEEVIPVGVLYLPARDAVISGNRDMGDGEKQRLIDKELTRKGLILDEPTVLEAMEYPSEQGIRFLPIRVSAKTGKITGDALVTAEQLGRLKGHIQTILKEICIQMRQGEITADPYWRGPTQNACLYCDYSSACHFEEGVGDDHRRWIPSIRNSEFWSYLNEQESGGGQDGD
jgi:ATP-dependent helicase/nuclease subunit B